MTAPTGRKGVKVQIPASPNLAFFSARERYVLRMASKNATVSGIPWAPDLKNAARRFVLRALQPFS